MGLSVTSDAYSAGLLTLYNGSAVVGSLAIGGAYVKRIFALHSDDAGGTTITAVADVAPKVTVPGAVTDAVNTARPIGGVSITAANAVLAHQTMTVTLTDLYGALAMSAAGGAAIVGSGTTGVAISGSLSQVNAALATLSYTEAVKGADTITILASNGNGLTGKAALKVNATATPASVALFSQGLAGLGATAMPAAITDLRGPGTSEFAPTLLSAQR